MNRINALNTVVVLIGLVIALLGLNIGLGGITTLGWQASVDFISVTDTATFHIQDSHIRFIGGVWFCVGAVFVVGGIALESLRPTLMILCGMIAVAGLFRLSDMNSGVIMTADIAPSLAFELLGFPLLAFWLKKTAAHAT